MFMSVKQKEFERERLRQEDERILREEQERLANEQAEKNAEEKVSATGEERMDKISEMFDTIPENASEAERIVRVAEAEYRAAREEFKEFSKRKIAEAQEESNKKIAELDKQIVDLEEKIEIGSERAEQEKEAFKEKHVRLMAEFQNYKKRTEKERQDVYDYANEDLMTELLTVLDNFERAFESESDDQQFVEGMKLIYKQLLDVMTKSGLEEIEAEGKPFDPNFHKGVVRDDNENYDSDVVTEVIQKGYTLNGKVIRPSVVKVNN